MKLFESIDKGVPPAALPAPVAGDFPVWDAAVVPLDGGYLLPTLEELGYCDPNPTTASVEPEAASGGSADFFAPKKKIASGGGGSGGAFMGPVPVRYLGGETEVLPLRMTDQNVSIKSTLLLKLSLRF